MQNLTGQQFGNYLLLKLLGRGGFADVYLGEQIHLKTHAAIKILHIQLSEVNRADFLQEARAIARLVHPYIIRVLDFGLQNDIPYLIMDYAPHGTVRQSYLQGKPHSPSSLFPIIGQAASALQYAHDNRIIHRDVKPENMLLGTNNTLLLSDFGLALVLQSTNLKTVNDISGTVSYMAPEQLKGKPSPASDQYALGVIVYEWLTGRPPFRGTFLEVSSQHLHVSPTPLHEKVTGISPALENVVMTALAKEPQQRFSSVQVFAKALLDVSQSNQPASLIDLPTFQHLPEMSQGPTYFKTNLASDKIAASTVQNGPATPLPRVYESDKVSQPTPEALRGPVTPLPPVDEYQFVTPEEQIPTALLAPFTQIPSGSAKSETQLPTSMINSETQIPTTIVRSETRTRQPSNSHPSPSSQSGLASAGYTPVRGVPPEKSHFSQTQLAGSSPATVRVASANTRRPTRKLFWLSVILVLAIVVGTVGVGVLYPPARNWITGTTGSQNSTHQPISTTSTVVTPTTVACGNAVSDTFTGPNFAPQWFWSAGNKGTYTLSANGLAITAPAGTDFRAWNMAAPHLLRTVSGDFDATTSLDFPAHQKYQGAGILLFQDEKNFIRLEHGYALHNGITYEYSLNNNYIRIADTFKEDNPARLPDDVTSIDLRLKRQGDQFSAWMRQPGQDWQQINSATISFQKELKIGLVVVNTASGTPITAQFSQFQMGC